MLGVGMEDGTKFLFQERMHNSVSLLKILKYTFQWGEHFMVWNYISIKAIFLIKKESKNLKISEV